MTTPSTSLQKPPAPKFSWCGHTGRPVSLKACFVAEHGQRKCSTSQNVTKVSARHQSYHWETWACHNWAAVYAQRSFPHTATFIVKASVDCPSLYCTVKCTQVNRKTLTCVNITAQSPKSNILSVVLSPFFCGEGAEYRPQLPADMRSCFLSHCSLLKPNHRPEFGLKAWSHCPSLYTIHTNHL